MSKDLNILVKGITEQRGKSLPEMEAADSRLSQILQALETVRSSDLRRHPDVAMMFNQVPFDSVIGIIQRARQDVALAKARLLRSNISIAIAGAARQGKSQMLQMLTGLGPTQIPTGDGGFCTASRSEIFNDPGQSRATVYFMSQATLLSEKIWPAYSPAASGVEGALGLSPRPGTIEEFACNGLPALADENQKPSLRKFYQVLRELHEGLQDSSIRNLVGSRPREVPIDDLRPYLTKDDASAAKYYHVVEKVEVHTPFEVGLPSGMKVFDLPGLGEMSPSIRKTMLKAVTEDADIVMLLRRPDPVGDDWQEDDFKILDNLKGVFDNDASIQPQDWIALILNQDSRPGKENIKNVQNMLRNAPKGFHPVICDCGSKDTVREVVTSNMEVLLRNAERIDNLRIAAARSAYQAAIAECQKIIDQVNDIYGTFASTISRVNFRPLFEKFLGDLRGPFKKDPNEQLSDLDKASRLILQKAFAAVFAKMTKEYEKRKQDPAAAFPAHFPIYSIDTLTSKFSGGVGSDGVCDDAVRNQLWAILHLFHEEMAQYCDKIKAQYFDTVAKLILEQNTAIRNIIKDESAINDETSENKIKKLQAVMLRKNENDVPNLVKALEHLLEIKISYESHILPFFHENTSLADFDPYDPAGKDFQKIKTKIHEMGTDYEGQARELFGWMQKKTGGVLAKSESSATIFKLIAENIFRTFKANYKTFVLQFIWSENIEDQWHSFAEANKTVLWKDVYSKAAAQNELGMKLKDLLDTLKKAAVQPVSEN